MTEGRLKDVTLDNAESSSWQTSTVDNGTPGAANSEPATATSYTVNEINTSDVVGEVVSTQGVVTGVYSGSTNRFTISDGTGAGSGLWIQGSDAVSLGDLVTVEGSVSNTNGLLRIELSSVQIDSSGNPLPEPVVVATGTLLGDDYVGVLVQTTGTCDQVNADAASGNDYGDVTTTTRRDDDQTTRRSDVTTTTTM